MILKKDNGDGSFDITWLEDEAEDTANLEDLKHLGPFYLDLYKVKSKSSNLDDEFKFS